MIYVMTGGDRLKNAFTEALGIAPGTDFEGLEYAKTEGWDSAAHMNLVAEIESSFDIMLATEDVIDMSSFHKARAIVAKYGVSLDS